jgi:tetratricopeptide (TPR) repeat protein
MRLISTLMGVLLVSLLAGYVAPVRGQDLNASVVEALKAKEAGDDTRMMFLLYEVAKNHDKLKEPAKTVNLAYLAAQAGKYQKAVRLLADAVEMIGPVELMDPVSVYFTGAVYLFAEALKDSDKKAFEKEREPYQVYVGSPVDVREKVMIPSAKALKDKNYRLVRWYSSKGSLYRMRVFGSEPEGWNSGHAAAEMAFNDIEAGMQAGWGALDTVKHMGRYLSYVTPEDGKKDSRQQKFIDQLKSKFEDLTKQIVPQRNLIRSAAWLRRAWAGYSAHVGDKVKQELQLRLAASLAKDGMDLEEKLAEIGTAVGVHFVEDAEAYLMCADSYREYINFLQQRIPELSDDLVAATYLDRYVGAMDNSIKAITAVERLTPLRCEAWFLHVQLVSATPVFQQSEHAALVVKMTSLLKKVEETGKDSPECLYNAAALYGPIGQAEAMMRTLERFLIIAPEDPRAEEAKKMLEQIKEQMKGPAKK